jgi:hypothetical protein
MTRSLSQVTVLGMIITQRADIQPPIFKRLTVFLIAAFILLLEYPFSCDQERPSPNKLLATLGLNNSPHKLLKLDSSNSTPNYLLKVKPIKILLI